MSSAPRSATFPDRDGRITNAGQQAAYVWTEMPAPVIAAIHGPALGAGFQIALAADIRFIAPDAKMSVLEIRWGLVPDMTGTQMLPRLVGLDVAKELAFTGRMVSGEEAVELGLATHLADDPRAAALDLAREIASKNPHAVRGVKQLVEHGRTGAARGRVQGGGAHDGVPHRQPQQPRSRRRLLRKARPELHRRGVNVGAIVAAMAPQSTRSSEVAALRQ